MAVCDLSKPGWINVYAPSGNDLKPLATIADGPDTRLRRPVGVALDSSGQIYIANDGYVSVYPSGTNQNVAPLETTTTSPNTSGLALDSARNLYLSSFSGGSLGNGSIYEYAPGSKGDASPTAIISFADAVMPAAVAVDSGKNFSVIGWDGRGDGKSNIYIYPPDSQGRALPVATIEGVQGGKIAIGPQDMIYVANTGNSASEMGSIDIYPGLLVPQSAPGKPEFELLTSMPGYPRIKPWATLSGPQTKLSHPKSIALDSSGWIYVLNAPWDTHLNQTASITIYQPLGNRTGHLDQEPIVTISGPETMLDVDSTSIAVWNGPKH